MNRKIVGDYRVGCLFSAIGGFSRAFQQAGATVVWANEKDRYAAQTFKENFPEVNLFVKPVENLSVYGDSLESVDILTAGFPCQPFSIAGKKKGFHDERGLLFFQIIRIINEFALNRPKVILLENVRNFRVHDNGNTFKRVKDEIQKAGYWFAEKNAVILNTADYTDIPQNRERIFMVALDSNWFSHNNFEFPDKFQGNRRRVKEFLDINRKADSRYYIYPGSRYYDLFKDAIEHGKRESVYQLRRNYVRENKSGECFTLMANMGEGGHNQPVIKDRWGIRKLTPRECARLQGYEDKWFIIPEGMSHTQIYKQIGNSVTIPLVKRIAENILRQLDQLLYPNRIIEKEGARVEMVLS